MMPQEEMVDGYVDIPSLWVLESNTGVFRQFFVNRPFNIVSLQVMNVSYDGTAFPVPAGASVILVISDTVASWTNANWSYLNGNRTSIIASYPIQPLQPVYDEPGMLCIFPSIEVKNQYVEFTVTTNVGPLTAPLATNMTITVQIIVRVPIKPLY